MQRFLGTGFLLLSFIPGVAMGQNAETGFLNRSLDHEGSNHLYQVYVPHEYNESVKWPVILFLHGSGERGNDGLKQTTVGLASAIRYNPERWPAIVVFPQAPAGESWSGTVSQVAMAALDATVAEFSVDESRIYLTGLSLGGRGVWQLAYEFPERFSALVPVCGFVEGNERYSGFLPDSPEGPYLYLARRLGDIPIWIFHGDEDPVLPVAGARQMAEALKGVGADVQYTELPGVGHNAWDPAYGLPELPVWLLSQTGYQKEVPMRIDQVREFATSYTAAWCSQDAASVAAFFAENGSLKINEGATSLGRTAITAAAQDFMTTFPDMIITMNDLKVVDDHFEYHWTLTGTNTGPGGSGNTVRISGYEEWTIGPDGLITVSKGHFDEVDYGKQLGIDPGGR